MSPGGSSGACPRQPPYSREGGESWGRGGCALSRSWRHCRESLRLHAGDSFGACRDRGSGCRCWSHPGKGQRHRWRRSHWGGRRRRSSRGSGRAKKLYSGTPVLATRVPPGLKRLPTLGAASMSSSSSSIFAASSAGATRVFRNHGSSGGRRCLSPLELERLVWASAASMSTRACAGSR